MTTTTTPVVVLDGAMIASIRAERAQKREADPKVRLHNWTEDNADAGLAKVKTPQSAAEYIAEAVDAYNTAGNTRMMAAAYATAAMIRQGMQQKDVADVLSLSAASIVQYKRMAVALNLGISPKDEATAATWTALGSGAGAQDKKVGAVIAKKGVTKDDIVEAAAEYLERKNAPVVDEPEADETGGDNGTNTSSRTAGGNTNQTEKEGEAPAPRNNSGRLDQIETMLAALTRLSKKERERLEDIAGRIHLILHPEDAEEAATGTDG